MIASTTTSIGTEDDHQVHQVYGRFDQSSNGKQTKEGQKGYTAEYKILPQTAFTTEVNEHYRIMPSYTCAETTYTTLTSWKCNQITL